MKRALVVAATIPVVLLTAWWTLALLFAGPAPAWLSAALASIYADHVFSSCGETFGGCLRARGSSWILVGQLRFRRNRVNHVLNPFAKCGQLVAFE
jgi:hypothetical protein